MVSYTKRSARRSIATALFVLVAMSAVAGGGVERSSGEMADPNGFVVYASVAPQAYFIRRIGGEHVTVGVVIGPGQDAHTYDPTPREIERLGSAELLFTTGLEYEAAIVSALQGSGAAVTFVDLTAGIELRELEPHWHDPTVPHSHANEPGDPHIWLGPQEVRIQAATVRDALVRARPNLAADFEAGYRDFVAEVDAIDRELEALLSELEGTTILVYHPAFGYFTDRYGLLQLAIEAGGREPSPRLLQVTIEKALAAGVVTVFTQPEYDDVASQAVARAIGARTVAISDLGENWPELMRRIGQAIAAGS